MPPSIAQRDCVCACGNRLGQSRWQRAGGPSVGVPTCAPLNAPSGAASRAARAATPDLPGWTPGMPCGACLRGWAAPRSLRSLGGRLARLRRAPPRFAWAPSGRPGGRPAATLAGTPALSFLGRPHLRSALTAVTSQPLRFAAWPGRVGVRLAALPARSCRCVSVPPRPRLGGAGKAGGRAPLALADRAPPPLGVGRWGALKPTTLRCRFSPGGSPVRSRPFGRVFGGSVETLASLTSTLPRARPGGHALRSFGHDGVALFWAPLRFASRGQNVGGL